MLTLARLHPTKTILMSSLGGTKDKTPEDILTEYRSAIGDIDAYAVAINNMTINIYGKAEDFKWYTDSFKEKFVSAKTHSQDWLNNVMHRLCEVPKSITDYDIIYEMYADEICTACRRLCDNYNTALHDLVVSDIKKLHDSVNVRIGVVDQLEKAINNYISLITNDVDFFDYAYEQASKSKGSQQKELNELKSHKKELEKEVKRLSDIITGTGIAGGVALTAAPVCFAFGPIGIFIGVLVAASAISMLITAIAESAICNQKEQEIQYCISQMNDVTKTIESLQAFTEQLDTIAAAARLAKSAAQQIKSYWSELESQMNDLLSELNAADKDAKKHLYINIINDIEESDKEWKEIVNKANIVANVNINIQKDSIEVKTA